MSESIGEFGVQLGLDATGFQTGMTQINRNLRTLNSEFRMNTAAIGLNGTALDRLRLKSTNLTSTMAQQQNKVAALEAAYNRSVTATGRDSAATQDLEQRLNLARAALSNMDNQLQQTNAQIATQSSRWTTMGARLSSVGASMQKFGSGLKNIGSKLTTSVTMPIAALGVAAGKMSLDFEASMAKVSTISDDTQVPIADLRKQILKLSNDTGIASTEIADNVYDAISAGQSTGDAVNFVTESTKLAKSGFAEAGQSLDLLTTILNSYGLKSSEVNKVSDVLIQTQNKGKVTVGELSESMGKVIPTANQYGVNLESVASGYAIMTSKGIKAAETTTYMNSMFNEMGKSGTVANKTIKESTGKTFPELIKSGKSVGDILNSMNDYAKKNNKSLTDMFGSAEAGKAALILSGNQGKDFNEMLKSMGDSAGETDKAFEKVNNTAGMKLTKAFNSLKNSGIKLGDALAPIIEKISSGIQKIADKFESLTPEQQKNIVKWGLMLAAIGPVLSIAGSLVTVVGGISTALGVVSTAMGVTTVATAGVGVAGGVASGGIGALGVAFGAALLPLAPWLLGAAAVVGAGLLIKNALEKEVIPEVDLFADSVVTTGKQIETANGGIITSYETTVTKISEGTKKAVESYLKLDQDATKALNDLYLNNTTITDKTVAAVTTKYNEMNTKVKATIDKRFADEYKTMQDFYAKSDVLTKVEEAKALLKMKSDNVAEKAEEDKSTKEILAIYQKAKNENRAVTLKDEEDIKVIQNRKKTTAITVMSASEAESKVILDRMKAYGSRVTAEQASAEILNANKSRDGTVKAANEQYTKTVASIKATVDQSTPQGKKLADSLIKDAERQKLMTIEKAEIMRSGVVGKIMSMNKENEGKIDESTGKIMTKWQTMMNKWDNWHPISKESKFTTTITTKYVSTGDKTAAVAANKNLNSYLLTNKIPQHAAGTNNFDGGLTTMHEKGYEVYNLNKGSKILNHEASLDLVKKTAQEVAKGVLANNQGSTSGLSLKIENFVNARQQDIEAIAVELQFYMKQQNLGRG